MFELQFSRREYQCTYELQGQKSYLKMKYECAAADKCEVMRKRGLLQPTVQLLCNTYLIIAISSSLG